METMPKEHIIMKNTLNRFSKIKYFLAFMFCLIMSILCIIVAISLCFNLDNNTVIFIDKLCVAVFFVVFLTGANESFRFLID